MMIMKNFYAVLLCLAIACLCVSCGNPSPATQSSNISTPEKATEKATEADKSITLTKNNIKDFLEIKFDYTKPKANRIGSMVINYSSDMTTSMYSVRAGSFDGVEIEMEVSLGVMWDVSKSDPLYDQNDDSNYTLKFRLPSNGSYETTHEICNLINEDPSTSSSISYKIISVTGRFIPQ